MLCLELQTGPQICKGYTYHTEGTQCLLKHGAILKEQGDVSFNDIQYGSYHAQLFAIFISEHLIVWSTKSTKTF